MRNDSREYLQTQHISHQYSSSLTPLVHGAIVLFGHKKGFQLEIEPKKWSQTKLQNCVFDKSVPRLCRFVQTQIKFSLKYMKFFSVDILNKKRRKLQSKFNCSSNAKCASVATNVGNWSYIWNTTCKPRTPVYPETVHLDNVLFFLMYNQKEFFRVFFDFLLIGTHE